jgi:hypothetical protein
MKRITFLAALLALVAGGGFMIAGSSAEPVTQPIAFSHKKHFDIELQCSACHELFERSAHAGRPKIETCILCHESAMTESVEEEKVREYAARGEEIPWRRLFRLPDHVYFSHQTHVISGRIECKSCHGSIGESATPPTKPEISLTMSDCIACHESKRASIDCLACHK